MISKFIFEEKQNFQQKSLRSHNKKQVKTEIKNLFHNCLGRKHLFKMWKKHGIKNNTKDWENYNNYCEEDFSIDVKRNQD